MCCVIKNIEIQILYIFCVRFACSNNGDCFEENIISTVFSRFSVAKRGNNGRGDFWLLIDEDRYFISVTYSTNGAAAITGSMTINIELTAGQIVRVENEVSTVIYGTDSNGVIQSFFTGYMLYAL